MTVSDSTLDQILEARRGEARAVVDVEEPGVKLVIFTLGEEWFAFQGHKVREVLPDSPVFHLPGCPDSLEGVINVRGDIETVIDLRLVLGLPPGGARDESRILLCRGAAMGSGVRVDSVREVTDVPQGRVQAPPHTIPEHRRPIILGVVEFGGRMVTLLDLDRVFADYRAQLG